MFLPHSHTMPENTGDQQTETTEPGFGFPKSMHLRKRGDFDRVFGSKHSQADRVLVLYGMANGLNVSRLGLVVSKKLGKANRRNRWKRLIREVFRLEQHSLPIPMDLVVIPRQGVEPNFQTIRRSFIKLARKLALS